MLTDCASLPPNLDSGSGVPTQLDLSSSCRCSQEGCPASTGKTEHGGNHHEGTRYLCPPLQPQPLVSHLWGQTSLLGDQKSPEEEEDGSLLICLALVGVLSHEGCDGIQEVGVQLLGLVEDEQGLPAALQGLADLPLQLGLQQGGQSGAPGTTQPSTTAAPSPPTQQDRAENRKSKGRKTSEVRQISLISERKRKERHQVVQRQPPTLPQTD